MRRILSPAPPVLAAAAMLAGAVASWRRLGSRIVWGWFYPTHGAGAFGFGHGARLREWIEANYRPLTSTTEAYVLLRRI